MDGVEGKESDGERARARQRERQRKRERQREKERENSLFLPFYMIVQNININEKKNRND